MNQTNSSDDEILVILDGPDLTEYNAKITARPRRVSLEPPNRPTPKSNAVSTYQPRSLKERKRLLYKLRSKK